ncbi:MAG: DUF2167 domain-containing protein [Pseudomonadales bacterium]
MRFSRCVATFGLVLVWQGALAQTSPEQVSMTERSNVFEQASRSSVVGPASIELLGKATLELAQDYVFVGPPEAFRILQTFDSSALASEVLGLVFPKDHSQQWFVSVDAHDPQGTAYNAGHVQASNAQDLGFAPLQSSHWINESGAEARNPIVALLQGDSSVDRPFALSVTATAAGNDSGRLNAEALANAFQYTQRSLPEIGIALLKRYWIALAVLLLGLSWWIQARLTRLAS